MVPPCSIRISRVPTYLSNASILLLLIYGAITLFGWLFQTILINSNTSRIQAISLSLATTWEISVDFFSYRYLDVSIPYVRFRHLCIQCKMLGSLLTGFPIQISSDQCLLPAPRGFSQAATSFVASYCQGIHHVRLIS